jgi:hypothetical protein
MVAVLGLSRAARVHLDYAKEFTGEMRAREQVAARRTGCRAGGRVHRLSSVRLIGAMGDYSAAVADEHGNIWFCAEYIPNSPRTALANWGTFIGEVPIK